MGLGQKIWDRITGKKSLISAANVSMFNGYDVSYTAIPSLQAIDGNYNDRSLCMLYHEVAEIYAPVHLIATGVSQAVFQVKKLKDDSIVYDNKYMNALLSTPNPLQNFQQLVYQAIAYELITGKNFMYAGIADGIPINYRTISTLKNLPADGVQVNTPPVVRTLSATQITDIISEYLVSDGHTALQRVPTEKVLYTKYSSLDIYDLNVLGKSPLLSARKAIDNLIAVYSARNVIYTKRGALGFVVSKKTDDAGVVALTPKEKEEAQKVFNDSYGLTKRKQNPIGIVSVPVEYINIAASIRDLEPFKETEYDAAAIFAVYNVPRELMPKQEGATFENLASAKKSLYNDVIIPKAKSFVQSLSTFLKLEDVGLYLDCDFSTVDVLQANKKEKADVDSKNNETYRIRFINGISTLNDWRVGCGMEVVPNAFYDKLVYDMTPQEMEQIKIIVNLSKPPAATPTPSNEPTS